MADIAVSADEGAAAAAAAVSVRVVVVVVGLSGAPRAGVP